MKKHYVFESANNFTVEIDVFGEYVTMKNKIYAKDISATYARDTNNGHIGNDKDFYETDNAEEIMQWLVDEGIEFQSKHSMWFNLHYIQSVLIDEDTTEEELLNIAAAKTEDECAEFLEYALHLN